MTKQIWFIGVVAIGVAGAGWLFLSSPDIEQSSSNNTPAPIVTAPVSAIENARIEDSGPSPQSSPQSSLADKTPPPPTEVVATSQPPNKPLTSDTLERIRTLIANGQLSKALSLAETAQDSGTLPTATLAPLLEELFTTLIQRAMDSGNLTEAQALLSRFKMRLPGNTQLAQLEAAFAWQSGDPSTAYKAYRSLQDQSQTKGYEPGSKAFRGLVTALVRDLEQTDRRSDIVEVLKAELKRDPGFSPFLVELGRAEWLSGNYEIAIDYLQRSIKADASLADDLAGMIEEGKRRLGQPDSLTVALEPSLNSKTAPRLFARVNDFSNVVVTRISNTENGIVISTELASQLGLSGNLASTDSGTRTVTLKLLDFGGLRFNNISVSVANLDADTDVILGQNALPAYHINQNSNQVTFSHR